MPFTIPTPSDPAPKRNAETSFAFLNRSSRPEIGRVRAFVQELVSRYPAVDRDEMVARIRSGDDRQFDSATFELLLYGYFSRLGYTLAPHPVLPGTTKRPDFHVTSQSGAGFYIEAVLASEHNEQNPSAQARIGLALDALAKASHPNFLVSVDHSGEPSAQPPGTKLRDAILHWLDTLDPDEVAGTIAANGPEAAPTLSWNHEEWEVVVSAIPISTARRGKATTLIGSQSGDGGFIDAWTPLRNAIKAKGTRYGDLAAPLLVAVNFNQFHLERTDEMQALFGQEQFTFSAGSAEPRFGRALNGAWSGPNGPQVRRVSGACFFNDLTPYTVATRRHTLYFNPWASRPLPDCLRQVPHAIPHEGKVSWYEGSTLQNVFNLPLGWPE